MDDPVLLQAGKVLLDQPLSSVTMSAARSGMPWLR
jgi:hypothetical protein